MEQTVRLGEVGEPWDGRWVGVSSLRMQRLLLLMASAEASPRDAAAMLEVEEYQAGWWALKLPRMIVSLLVSRSCWKFEV